MINPKDLIKFQQAQSRLNKQLEQIFATEEKRGIRVVVRGDRKVETIEIDGEEQKELRDLINSAMKEASKKAEKQLRGQLGDLGIPGL